MNNVCIIDIGTARTKVAISNSEIGQHKHLKEDNKLSENVSNNQLNISYVQDYLLPSIERFKCNAKELGCSKLLIVGTHLLRTISNAKEVETLISDKFGAVNFISSTLEGQLFYKWMKHLNQNLEFSLVDVGGGSVQIITGSSVTEIVSIPTGTFTLEKDFQSTNSLATKEELQEMRSFIRTSLENYGADLNCHSTLIMGSNCMEDFLRQAFKMLDMPQKETSAFSVSLSDLSKLLDTIVGREYTSLGEYYSSNPGFMYGADKALINILEIAKYLKAEKIIPTNESLSSSLLNLLSNSNEDLKSMGIRSTLIA